MRRLLLGLLLGFMLAVPSIEAQAPPFGHPGPFFNCVVSVATATTLTAVGGACVAPGAGRALYITSITSSTNAAGITADSFNTLKSGTGSVCATGTAIVWAAFSTAAVQTVNHVIFPTAIKVAANSDLCWINSTAGSKVWVITGYIGNA